MKSKPTQTEVDALAKKGLTVKQIADIYQCSVNKIATLKSRKPQGWREDGISRNPISPDELEQARRVPIGTLITVFNLRKAKPGDEMSWGVLEESRIVRKFPHVVLLENGITVDYADIALRIRSGQEE